MDEHIKAKTDKYERDHAVEIGKGRMETRRTMKRMQENKAFKSIIEDRITRISGGGILDDFPVKYMPYRGWRFTGDARNDMLKDLLWWRNSNIYKVVCLANKLQKGGKNPLSSKKGRGWFRRLFGKKSSPAYNKIKEIVSGGTKYSLNHSIWLLEREGDELSGKALTDAWNAYVPYEELGELLKNVDMMRLFEAADIVEFTRILAGQ